MQTYDNDQLDSLRTALLDHPLYARRRFRRRSQAVHGRPRLCRLGFHVAAEAASTGCDLHQSAVVPGGQCAGGSAHWVNDIVIGEETDVDLDGANVSHL